MRPSWLFGIVSICGASAVVFGQCDVARAATPNVIIVLTDDQGYGDLSCHGNPVLKTPHLDRFHAESVRLTDFHASPMCTPTRGQLLSGLDALRNGAMNVSSGRTFLRRDIPTMADLFAAAGYRCGHFGKWHLGDNYPYRPHDRGFHEAVWFPSSHIGSAPDEFSNDYLDDVYYHMGERKQYKGYTTDVFFAEGMRWMREQAAHRQPFFCYLPMAAAHGPLHVPAKYREAYASQNARVAAFFGMIANIDENMQRLDEFLRETQLFENTLVIFMTDNGGTAGVPVYNAAMRGQKISLWEGGHRVPCFLRWPAGKIGPPCDISELTQVQDVLPTLLDLCAIKPSTALRCDGTSLAPLLRGERDALADRMLVINYSRMNAPVPMRDGGCVLWKRWRLIGDDQLYELDSDPLQETNVIDRHPEVAQKMRAHRDRWWSEIEPVVNEHSAITLGHDAEPESQLSPADWQDVFLDQGAQVRSGVRRNGPWNVVVDRQATYKIELRRWPRESPAPLNAEKPAMPHAFGTFPEGKALPIGQARLKIGDFDRTTQIEDGAEFASFDVPLNPGRIQLQTWFLDAEGREICGAYYAYVKRNGTRRD